MFQNSCKDKKMTNIVPTLAFLILFCSCISPGKNGEYKKASVVEDAVEINAEEYIPGLSATLNEISGLIIYDGLFWGFNDSGGKDELYGFDHSGEIMREVEIDDADNDDWESITQNEKHIFIGDFGNNGGHRKNLCIYKIKKKDLDNEKKQKVEAKKIEIEYASQEEFGYSHLSTPFDCEAMVEFEDNLYIFSKDWAERTTVSYKIPVKRGKYKLHAVDTFDVHGLITGADINPDKNRLALLGYENYKAFIWLFSGFEGDDFLSGKAQLIQLPNLDNAQTEGICFLGNDSLLVACENSRGIRQQVFLVDLKKISNETHSGE